MVGGDENYVVVLDGLGNDLLDAAVNASDSGADGVVNNRCGPIMSPFA